MKAAKAAKIVTAVFLFYIGIVIVFESLLGYFQPQAGTAMVITTFDNENNGNDLNEKLAAAGVIGNKSSANAILERYRKKEPNKS